MVRMEEQRMPADGEVRRTRREFMKRTIWLGAGLAAAGTVRGARTTFAAGARLSPETLTAVIPGSSTEQAVWNQVVAGFKQSNPNVTVTFDYIPQPSGWGAFFASVETRLVGGAKYDLVNIPTEGQRLFASKGVMQPLDAFVSRDKAQVSSLLSDLDPHILPAIRQHSSPGGETYYIPYGYNTMSVWYNKALFKAAGVPFPSQNWTWNDFMHAAETIGKPNAPAGKQVYGFNFSVGIFDAFDPWVFTNSASLLNSNWTEATINSPKAVESLTFQRELVARKLAPEPGGTFDEVSAMAQGRLAMLGCGWWYVPNFQSLHMIDKVGMAPWPINTRHGSPVGYGSIAMFKQSQNQDLGWEFIKYMLSTPVQIAFAKTAFVGGGNSIRRSIATGPIAAAAGPTGYTNSYDAIAYANIVEGIDQYNTLELDVDKMYQQILAGNVSPASGLQQLSSQIQSIL
jgi:multiple sugar transport system substrate-binding protein